jgi:aldose 1-epimerase
MRGNVMVKQILQSILTIGIIASLSCTPSQKGNTMIQKTVYGQLPDGRTVYQFTLANHSGCTANIINYGAIITSLVVPDRNGKLVDVVLGYDSLKGYLAGRSYFGTIVGRFGNRIEKGQFELDGKKHQLATNDGENHLHGGIVGFDKVLWDAKAIESATDPAVELTYVSPDGEEGYPGKATLSVTYTLTAKNELRIDYKGTTDQPTIFNPTHHSYFNLSGSFANTILNHLLTIEADSCTPVNSKLIPTGEIASVENTPLDFRSATAIGARINEQNEQLVFGKGYDHNWVLRNYTGEARKAADLYEPNSGILMTVLTDQPGLQFYSGNFLDGSQKGKGVAYQYRTGLCLETQHYPDSPNKPQFPNVVLKPGETYRQTTIYQFSTR